MGSPGKQTLTGALGGGAAIPAGPRARLEASLGADLGGVRIHDDARAQASAAQLGANAYTVGQDIHFAAGQLQPESADGMHLLAHEVAHTVQQGGGSPGVQAKLAVSQAGDASEVEADRFADHIVHGGAMPALSQAPSSIQRQEAPPEDARVENPAYDASVTAIIQDTLHDYQNIEVTVQIPATTAATGDATATAAATATTAADGAATATPDGAATATPDGTAPVELTSPLTISVAIPYWNNKYPDYDPTKPADGDNPKPSDAYTAANQGDRHAHRDAFGRDTTKPVATAKGDPGEITQIVQNAITSGLVPAPAPTPGVPATVTYWTGVWKRAIEHWMDEAGVGLDCNGLVYEALLRIRGGGIGARTTGEAREGSGVIDTDPPGGYDSRTGVTTEMLGGAPSPEYTGLGKDVKQIDILPGDVMYLPGHVRIVMSILQRDRNAPLVEFTTAESTVDPLSAAEATKNGPRMQYWKWDGKELLRHHADQLDSDYVSSGETPSYREHLRAPDPAAP